MKTKLIFLIVLTFISVSITTVNAQSKDKQTGKSEIEVKSIEAQKTLVIKAETTMEEIGPKMGELYGKLFGYLEAKGIQPISPPFAVYYKWDLEKGITVFEVGVPIAQKDEGTEEIKYKEFPAMKVVSKFYQGPYEKMEPVYTEIEQYIKDNNLKMAGTVWDIYLTDPEEVTDPNQYQTIVYYTVEE